MKAQLIQKFEAASRRSQCLLKKSEKLMFARFDDNMADIRKSKNLLHKSRRNTRIMAVCNSKIKILNNQIINNLTNKTT